MGVLNAGGLGRRRILEHARIHTVYVWAVRASQSLMYYVLGFSEERAPMALDGQSGGITELETQLWRQAGYATVLFHSIYPLQPLSMACVIYGEV